MKKKNILVAGHGASSKIRADKIIRCKDCEYLHENGNCLKVGGLFSSIDDRDCPQIKKKNKLQQVTHPGKKAKTLSVQDLTIEKLTFIQTGHSVPSGFRIRHGRLKRKYKYIEEYRTKIGIFSPAEWNRLALQVVKDTGKYDLYLAVMDYCRKKLCMIYKEEKISEYALECIAWHSYETWEDFNYEKIISDKRRKNNGQL